MPPDPPRKKGLPKQYPPVMLNYPPVPKVIETPDEPREEWLLTFLNLISIILPGLLKNQYWNADSLTSSWFFIVFFISPL